MTIVLGAIADDFTGATDLASTLVAEGMRVVQVLGLPDDDTDTGDADAVVIALKSRTCEPGLAVRQSVAACDWLRGRGATQIVFKYCSTFDSSPRGNIGPVADALLTATDTPLALVCPAFPANGRTVYQGTLFVHELPLGESSMKDHPLTPMRDSSLIRLMQAQSRHKCGLIALQTVRAGPEAIRTRIADLAAAGHRYAVADALTDDDLRQLGTAAADHGLVTGGSGIATGLPTNLRRSGRIGTASAPALPRAAGRSLVLAGSCSSATRAQIARVKDTWPTRKIDVDAAAAGGAVAAAVEWTMAQPDDTPVLIYGSADPEEVAATQARYGAERAGALVEDTLSGIARQLHGKGFDRIVVAGGETAGAVVTALGATSLRIGPQIAPGVPWCDALGAAPLALALKSGNFGSETFFQDAFEMLT
ncbi:3-oxo-tetronate kinase [Sulfitobacter sp. D35]|uniref:3-oxo-tetronate kinase n=1 Tax=Sulfitobacter sp. D35 TaxID=3083252 RepID=UPI00296EE9FB|nr:3-oxo-tetronate kinase [Sulfitobacter sp. D35]MDW4499165.1 3-oxo-tetronate kinase [Sulfitobacter sp. D35]